MNRPCASVPCVLLLVLLSVGLSAQGRGRGGGGGTGNGSVPPTLLTVYDNTEYGMKFPAPPDFSVFTPEQPGRFRQMFADRRIIYMIDSMGTEASVSVRYLPKATDAELSGFKSTMETNPPQAKLPEYKKISVGMIKIGTARDKDAVEYVYDSKAKDTVTRTRQVVFLHNGNGFIFTCVAPQKEYPSVDGKSFQRLFATIEFK